MKIEKKEEQARGRGKKEKKYILKVPNALKLSLQIQRSMRIPVIPHRRQKLALHALLVLRRLDVVAVVRADDLDLIHA